MSISELMPMLQALPRDDMRQARDFLAEQLKLKELIDLIPTRTVIELNSPVELIDPEGKFVEALKDMGHKL